VIQIRTINFCLLVVWEFATTFHNPIFFFFLFHKDYHFTMICDLRLIWSKGKGKGWLGVQRKGDHSARACGPDTIFFFPSHSLFGQMSGSNAIKAHVTWSILTLAINAFFFLSSFFSSRS
jgi:hypothetical protein